MNIPQETLDWLESVGTCWYEKPYVCGVPYNSNGKLVFMHYSAEYLKDTPLHEIRFLFEDHVRQMNESVPQDEPALITAPATLEDVIAALI